MNVQYDEKIHVLRNAQFINDWNSCRESLCSLATLLQKNDVANLVLDQARQFLLQYLEGAPDDAAITDAISTLVNVSGIVALSRSSQIVRSVLLDKARTPGINNYRNALREVEQLITFDPSSEQDIELFVDIISGLIMASLDYKWGNQNRELWLSAFEHKKREDFFIRANYFVTDEQVIALNTMLWSRVADGIDRALK